ncbi:hypothetical protein BV898_04095 [Hypsibius exemplaris]|uniref:PH domain-containing protein n=1 Tax=Hypsibius exemplaris TaxID=2072580 RepID=A0A1W0X3M0_HYPEX|nr:hypothetical protein BV898_04095 [Hypsibius exemplaris]
MAAEATRELQPSSAACSSGEPANLLLPKSLSFTNLQQNAQRTGFLLKHERGLLKRLLGRSWQRKYCLLSGYHFYWFKNKKGAGREKSNGVINLRYFDRCVAVPTDSKHAGLPHAVELASSQSSDSHHSFLFQADSLEEQQRWLKDIQLVIFQCQTQGRTGTGQRVSTRPSSSQTASPVLHRAAAAVTTVSTAVGDDERRPRSSSIPEAGASGVYRSVSGDQQPLADDSDVFAPEATVSRSESRNTRPDLIPRMPTYNQVVSELQTRLHSRSSDEPQPDHPHTGSRLSSRSSPAGPSPNREDLNTSPEGSSSVSSYDNTQHHEQQQTVAKEELPSPTTARDLISPNGTTNLTLEARFDSVLRMMEDLTDEEVIREGGVISGKGGPEYAMPFGGGRQGEHHPGPAVAPKPRRELYEALLSNNVGPYLVSPVVNVS